MFRNLFTSEQVGIGHPDKICDQISDGILDECLRQDKNARVACETFAKNKEIIVGGEITTTACIDLPKTVQTILKEKIGLVDYEEYNITNLLDAQSPDISLGVDTGGAGDQGIMFGYACNETKDYMPLAFELATKALVKLQALKHPMLLPDAKSQVTIDYTNQQPSIDTFLISTQHKEEFSLQQVTKIVHSIMEEVALEYHMNIAFEKLVNPTGRFVIGGTVSDAGLTGRKIIADTYGGYARHGGGAFSGKDATKVDRSAAYMARYLAKNIVASGLMDSCEIQLAYAIGIKEPVSIHIQSYGTEKMNLQMLEQYIYETVDLTPQGMMDKLNLRAPDFSKTTVYGHFGFSSADLAYEQLDLVPLFHQLK